MKEVSHGGTSFIVGRERSPPVNEGFAGVRPTFCLCSPKKAAFVGVECDYCRPAPVGRSFAGAALAFRRPPPANQTP